MTADQIANQIKQEADARLPEVIERLFPIVLNHHAHDAWRDECECSYCRYIRHTYVPFKLQIHNLKKRIRYLEWTMNDVDIHTAWNANENLEIQQLKLMEIKREKRLLKEGK